ncbi:hypothetical protein [Methylobacterium planeticum]|nr:hypothetical protein [Methylobacterium planeticum]
MSSKVGRLSDQSEAEYKRIVALIGHGSNLARNADLRSAKRAVRRLLQRLDAVTAVKENA